VSGNGSNNVLSSSTPTKESQVFGLAVASALQQAATIAGPGVLVKNAAFPIGCSPANYTGIFSEGGGSISFSSGVVLSTGYLSHLLGGSPASCHGPGYPPLDKLGDGVKKQNQKTTDASVLEIEFECEMDSDYYEVTLDYVFGSNEFGYELGAFDDIAAIFLNGEESSDNMATIEGQIISPNTIQEDRSYYVPYSHDNDRPPVVHGFSVPLKAVGRTKSKSNMIRMAVADWVDVSYNSYLFIDHNSLKCEQAESQTMPSTVPPSSPTETLAPTSSSTSTLPQDDTLFSTQRATAVELARKIAGATLRVTSASLIREACEATSAGVFRGGGDSIAFEAGIVLSTGHISSLRDGQSGACNGKTYPTLEALMDEGFAKYATVLEMAFECTNDNVGSISIDYVFGSFEYVGLGPNEQTKNNDAAGIFLNGQLPKHNIAWIDGNRPVSVNTIPVDDNLFADNSARAGNLAPLVSGHTKPLVAIGETDRKANVIRIAVLDMLDDSVDSFLFVKEGSLQCNERQTISPAPTPKSKNDCIETGKRCSRDKQCCQFKASKCLNKRCFVCQKLYNKCKTDSDCCQSEQRDGLAVCDNRKCRLAVCDNKSCRSCQQNEKACSVNADCCSDTCESGICKDKSRDRQRPSRRKANNRQRPSRVKKNSQ
jgi:hypothetical protein